MNTLTTACSIAYVFVTVVVMYNVELNCLSLCIVQEDMSEMLYYDLVLCDTQYMSDDDYYYGMC